MDRKIAFVSEEFARSLSSISVDIDFQNDRFIITGNHSDLKSAATVICNLGYIINYDGSNSFEVSDLNKYFDVLIDQNQLHEVTTELKQELSELAIEVIPQLDRTIKIVAKEIKKLPQAAIIICNLGYKCSYIDGCNFIKLSDYTKYSDKLIDKQIPLYDRTVAC